MVGEASQRGKADIQLNKLKWLESAPPLNTPFPNASYHVLFLLFRISQYNNLTVNTAEA